MYGKLIGGLIGLLFAGVAGLVLGMLAGHLFDRGLAGNLGLGSPARLARARATFFDTSFLLMGHIAKADGRISEAEIAQAESLMRQLGIQAEQRASAIASFKQGAGPEFQLDATIAKFNQDCAGPRQVAHTLLVFLIAIALADGVLADSERVILDRVAQGLGYRAAEFERILSMVEAQSHFHDYSPADHRVGADELDDAYRALGVGPGCTDRELKRAYRKLMSEHHPDKLVARGVPESMMKLATEKAQEIQAAYELVKRSRQPSS
jgi:DnaJ like chaperone protein